MDRIDVQSVLFRLKISGRYGLKESTLPRQCILNAHLDAFDARVQDLFGSAVIFTSLRFLAHRLIDLAT